MMPAANAVDAGNKKWTGLRQNQSIFILDSLVSGEKFSDKGLIIKHQ